MWIMELSPFQDRDNGEKFADYSQLVDELLWFFSVAVRCLTSSKRFASSVDPGDDPDPGNFNEILPLRDSGNCKNFAYNSINNDYNA